MNTKQLYAALRLPSYTVFLFFRFFFFGFFFGLLLRFGFVMIAPKIILIGQLLKKLTLPKKEALGS